MLCAEFCLLLCPSISTPSGFGVGPSTGKNNLMLCFWCFKKNMRPDVGP